MKKVKVNDESLWGKKMGLSHLGVVSVPEDGVMEIESDEDANHIINNCVGFTDVSDPVEDNVEESNEEVSHKANLLKMELKELQDICVEAQLPEDEWKKLKKMKLVQYILERTELETDTDGDSQK